MSLLKPPSVRLVCYMAVDNYTFIYLKFILNISQQIKATMCRGG